MAHLEDLTITAIYTDGDETTYDVRGTLYRQTIRFTATIRDDRLDVDVDTDAFTHVSPEDDAEDEYFILSDGTKVSEDEVENADKSVRHAVCRAYDYLNARREQAIRDVIDGRY